MLVKIFETGAMNGKPNTPGLHKIKNGTGGGEHNGYSWPMALPTGRELQILQLAANGLTGNDIAAQLNISPATVEKHRNNTIKKMKVANMVEAVAVAMRSGWIV